MHRFDKCQLKIYKETFNSHTFTNFRKQYPNGIRPGGLAIGDPGNLQCRQVFHAAMKKFRQSKQEARAEVSLLLVSFCSHIFTEKL